MCWSIVGVLYTSFLRVVDSISEVYTHACCYISHAHGPELTATLTIIPLTISILVYVYMYIFSPHLFSCQVCCLASCVMFLFFD